MGKGKPTSKSAKTLVALVYKLPAQAPHVAGLRRLTCEAVRPFVHQCLHLSVPPPNSPMASVAFLGGGRSES